MLSPQIYEKNISTLKQASLDKEHHAFMTDNEDIPVYNYDKVMTDYASERKLAKQPCSNDALYIDKDRITFIEFKNGQAKPKELMQKAYDSLLVLFDDGMGLAWCRDDFRGNISYSHENIDYILVWEDKNGDPRKRIENHVQKNGKLGLNRLAHYLYKEVHVMSKAEFQQEFVDKVESSWMR